MSRIKEREKRVSRMQKGRKRRDFPTQIRHITSFIPLNSRGIFRKMQRFVSRDFCEIIEKSAAE